jgi:hypothetical protein
MAVIYFLLKQLFFINDVFRKFLNNYTTRNPVVHDNLKVSRPRVEMSRTSIRVVLCDEKKCHGPRIIDEYMTFWAAKKCHGCRDILEFCHEHLDKPSPDPITHDIFFYHGWRHVEDDILTAVRRHLPRSSSPFLTSSILDAIFHHKECLLAQFADYVDVIIFHDDIFMSGLSYVTIT